MLDDARHCHLLDLMLSRCPISWGQVTRAKVDGACISSVDIVLDQVDMHGQSSLFSFNLPAK